MSVAGMGTTDKHTHLMNKIKVVPIMADNPEYNGPLMGIVLRECECGAGVAVEYGERKAMNKLKKELENGKEA